MRVRWVGADERVDQGLWTEGERRVYGCTRVMICGPRRRRNVGYLGNVRVEWRRGWWCRCHARRVLVAQSTAVHLNRPVSSTHFALHPITLPVTSIHYGPWKACTLRNRCTPFIYGSGWRQAVYRFCVRTLLSLCYHPCRALTFLSYA